MLVTLDTSLNIGDRLYYVIENGERKETAPFELCNSEREIIAVLPARIGGIPVEIAIPCPRCSDPAFSVFTHEYAILYSTVRDFFIAKHAGPRAGTLGWRMDGTST